MCFSQTSFLSTGPQSAFLLQSSEKSLQKKKKKLCFYSNSYNPALFSSRKKLNFFYLSRKNLFIEHPNKKLTHKSSLLGSFITSTSTTSTLCYQGSAKFSDEENLKEEDDIIGDSRHDDALEGKQIGNENGVNSVSSSSPSFVDGSENKENDVIKSVISSFEDGSKEEENNFNRVLYASPSFVDGSKEEANGVNVVSSLPSLSFGNANNEEESVVNTMSSSSSEDGSQAEENNVNIVASSSSSSYFENGNEDEENDVNMVSSSSFRDGSQEDNQTVQGKHPQEMQFINEDTTGSQEGISSVIADISDRVNHIFSNGNSKDADQDHTNESSLSSTIPKLVLFMGSIWEPTVKVLKNNPLVEVINGWSVWQEKRRLENLSKQADSNPMDAAKQTALLVELNKHSPGAVIKRFEQREHATDAQGVVEYLRALLLTNSISEYLPDDRSGRTSTLPTLLQELKQRASGGLDEALTAPGMTEKHPLHVVMVDAKGSNKSMRFVQELISTCLFMIFFSVMWVMFAALLRKYVNNMGGMGPSTSIGSAASYAPKEYNKDAIPEKNTTTFNDVKGCDEAKEELEEIVEYLKDPGKFTRLGGKLPKGVLLTGPPGTGKTLLAKAVAGEAGVPFFYRAGSEFEEMFVGVGARRVRALFQSAKKKAPCIIFIDEIDAIGSTRKQWEGHTKKTLHQLLVEMDGFESNEGIIVIAATNLAEILDPALTRPGRFDRHIVVSNPDVRGRQEILDLYLLNKPVGKDVDVNLLARGTPGFTGADLANLVNMAALKAAVEGTETITNAHLEFAKDKIVMGTERKSFVLSEEARKLTAYHESGHAVVAFNTVGAYPIHKATIIPRGNALGMVAQLPEKDETSISRMQLLARLDVAMGGRVAEELIFGTDQVTTGARTDLQHATALARHMVSECGMSNVVGPIFISVDDQNRSNDIQKNIDAEVVRLLKEAYERVKCLLKKHEGALHALASALLEHETLSSKQITQVLSPFQQTDIIETTEAEVPS